MKRRVHENIVDIIGRIHDYVLDPNAASDAVAGMAAMLNSDKAILVRLAPDRRRNIALGCFGMSRELINRILCERENPDSFLAHDSHWEPGRIASDNDCSRVAERQRSTAIYRDLLQPNDMEYTLLGVVESSDVHHILLWFHRGAKQCPFDKADKQFLDSMMPHWQRAIRQKLAYEQTHSALTASRAVLDRSPYGLYLLGRDGDVLYMNSTGADQCRSNVGLSIRNKALVVGDRSTRAAYGRMLAAARHGGKDGDRRLQPISFEKTNGRGNYQLGMRRLRMSKHRGSLSARCVIAVFAHDTDERADLSTDGLKSLYELTDAEARVCGLMYQTGNLPEAARLLGVSINTVKTHLNRSFRKVGVRSQAELVRRLNSQLYIS
ncbi:MAG: helix-turn-helix transcriptional regulator [Gammaproteobacteria bacterium]